MEYNLQMLKKLAGDDDQFIIGFLMTFKNTSSPIIRQMIEFEAQKKYEALGREAHKLIPGVSFLGADKLRDVLVKIEEGVKKEENYDRMHDYVTEAAGLVENLINVFNRDFNLETDE